MKERIPPTDYIWLSVGTIDISVGSYQIIANCLCCLSSILSTKLDQLAIKDVFSCQMHIALKVLVVSTVKAQWLFLSFRPLISFALDLKASFRGHSSLLKVNELVSNSTPMPGDLSEVPPSFVGAMSVATNSPQSSFPLPLSKSVDEETSSGCSGRVGAAEACLKNDTRKR